MKKKKIDPYDVFLGNLFTINENGIGEVSEIKYAVIRKKDSFFSKVKYISYPEEKEVYVGSYAVDINDIGIPFLINSVRLCEMVGYKKITAKQISDIIIENNDVKLLKKHI